MGKAWVSRSSMNCQLVFQGVGHSISSHSEKKAWRFLNCSFEGASIEWSSAPGWIVFVLGSGASVAEAPKAKIADWISFRLNSIIEVVWVTPRLNHKLDDKEEGLFIGLSEW